MNAFDERGMQKKIGTAMKLTINFLADETPVSVSPDARLFLFEMLTSITRSIW